MKLIAIETSTDTCSVALNIDGQIYDQQRLVPQGHARHVLPLIESLLQSQQLYMSDIDVIAFGQGPGSFTGLRIACAMTQGIAFALNKPVIAISSLAAMAQIADGQTIFPVLDARMGEIYYACYKRNLQGLVVLEGSEQVATPEKAIIPDSGLWQGVGSGWASYKSCLQNRFGERVTSIDEQVKPNAYGVAILAQAAWVNEAVIQANQAQPIYIRNKVADKPS